MFIDKSVKNIELNYSKEAFEKIHIEDFNFDKFKDVYLFDGEEEEYDFSSIRHAKGVLIESLFVKEEYQGLGCGSAVVEELKSSNETLIVYSLYDATPFWEKHGFTSVDGHEYIYTYNL